MAIQDDARATPKLVAHRGHASRYPENSLIGIESALRSGVHGVEFDVQITADGVPVVVHDADLSRVAGVAGNVREMTLAELRGVSVAERERLGDGFGHVPLPTLAEVVALLERWPGVTPYCEIKPESATPYRADEVVAAVLEVLAPVLSRTVVISFSERVVQRVRRLGAPAAGWCVFYYDEDARRLAEAIEPAMLVTNHLVLPADGSALWPGGWSWMVYEVLDASLALDLSARGAELIETMACEEMLADPRLASRPG